MNIFRRPLIPLLLAGLAAVLVSAAGASAFVGWPINATEVEFLLVPGILANSAFENTTYLTLAEQLKARRYQLAIVTDLRNAVRDVLQHIEPADTLLLQDVDGMRGSFAIERSEDVAGGSCSRRRRASSRLSWTRM